MTTFPSEEHDMPQIVYSTKTTHHYEFGEISVETTRLNELMIHHSGSGDLIRISVPEARKLIEALDGALQHMARDRRSELADKGVC